MPPPVPATAAPVASEPEPAGPLQDGSGLEYEEAAVTGPFSERLSCGRVPLWNAPFFIDAFADAYIPKHFGTAKPVSGFGNRARPNARSAIRIRSLLLTQCAVLSQ